jgi:homoserine O-acetyltransferase
MRMDQHGVGIVVTQYFHSFQPLTLASGQILPEVTLAYETYGTLNAARDNAILLLHALSGDAHAAGWHCVNDRKPGWWDDMVGPGRAFDTNKYFVICSNVIGGCMGSTGPLSINPATRQRYAADFPVVTIADMVNAQVRLIDSLGIAELFAVAGASMGGFQAIEWMAHHTSRVNSAILLATMASHHPRAIAWNSIGRQAIRRDPKWAGGYYDLSDPPLDGLAVARMVGHVTYLCDYSLQQRFSQRYCNGSTPHYTLDSEFKVESYLEYQAMRFNERFDPNSYIYITKAMDYWDVAAPHESLAVAMRAWSKPTCILSFESDWLCPTAESIKLVDAIRANAGVVYFTELHSNLGHDAFLLEFCAQTAIIQRFLDDVIAHRSR